MGKRKPVAKPAEPPAEQSLTYRLSDPGMDLLERAGLAGLYMALRAAEESKADLAPLTWELCPDAVTIRWTGPAKPTFEKLMKWGWQVKDDVLYLPAIHGERELAQFHLRTPSHTGIMRTFLQHTKVQPKGEPITRVVQLDENREITVSYQPPIIRPPKSKKESDEEEADAPKQLLKPWADLECLFTDSGEWSGNEIKLSSWIVPGHPNRYPSEAVSSNWKNKPWRGSARLALLLMLAPTTCLFLRLQGEGGNWVFVAPDVRELAEFDDVRRRINLDEDFTDVASMGDAGLQFLAAYATRNPRKTLGAGCRVVAMGRTGYYAKKPGQKLGTQSIRKAVLDVPPDPVPVKRYRLLQGVLPNAYVSLREAKSETADTKPMRTGKAKKPASDTPVGGPKAKGFIKLPAARGRIADNLVNGRVWYESLIIPMVWDREELERQRKWNKELNDRDGENRPTSLETILFLSLRYQGRNLMKLIQEEAMWDTEAEKVFVEAFWEVMDSLYAQEVEAARKLGWVWKPDEKKWYWNNMPEDLAIQRGGPRAPSKRFDNLTDDIRRKLTQAKTRTLLRAALAAMFAKAGRQKTIRNHPAAIWRLIDHPDLWRKGCDLALLALASHRKKEERELTTLKNGE